MPRSLPPLEREVQRVAAGAASDGGAAPAPQEARLAAAAGGPAGGRGSQGWPFSWVIANMRLNQASDPAPVDGNAEE